MTRSTLNAIDPYDKKNQENIFKKNLPFLKMRIVRCKEIKKVGGRLQNLKQPDAIDQNNWLAVRHFNVHKVLQPDILDYFKSLRLEECIYYLFYIVYSIKHNSQLIYSFHQHRFERIIGNLNTQFMMWNHRSSPIFKFLNRKLGLPKWDWWYT